MAIAIDETNSDGNYSDLVFNNNAKYENYTKNWKLMFKGTYSKTRKGILPSMSFAESKTYPITTSFNNLEKLDTIAIRGKCD